jgi:hypothetical protein
VELLKAVLVLKGEISDWKRLVKDNVMKYQLVDVDLMNAMEKSELINEEMMISFLNNAEEWSLHFIREYLIQYPNQLKEWENLKNLMIEKLNNYKPSNENKIIEFIFSLIIDLELKDFLKYSLEVFKKLESDKLKKMAIFPILKFGEESLLLKLKEYMKKDHDAGKFIMQFLNMLERNEWRFYY